MNIALRADDGKEFDGAVITFNNMRGVMALWIVLGHIGMNMNADQGFFMILQRLNLAVVGMFLFLSGYGLERGYANKEGYLKSVPLKKIPRLFTMALIQYIIAELCFLLIGFKRQTAGFIGEFFKNTNWYIWEIISLYIVFFLSHLVFKDVKAYYAAVILSLALMVFMYSTQGANAACYSGMAFPAGMMIYRIAGKAGKRIKGSYARYLIFSLILTAAAGASVLLPKNNIFTVLGKNFFSIMVSWLVLMIFLKIDIKSRVLGFFAAMSPEIYLYQFTASTIVSLMLFKFGILRRGLGFALLSVVLTFIMSVTVYLCRKTIERGLRKEYKGKKNENGKN
ncbi:MAG: acyltransferase [Lachnospiraceae bacterium]|nr:acyltransferase [Lachnospiraceae bacterium]